MRTRMGAIVLATTAVAALAVGAAPSALSAARPAASAARTWTVRPGGAVTATSGKTTLVDVPTGATLTCTASMSATLKSGGGLPGADIGSITAATYRCPTPVFSFKVTARGLPWHLNLTSYNPGTGVARGTISHLRLTFMAPSCSAVINGTSGAAADGFVVITYSSATGKLKFQPAGGNLHWEHVRGCAGVVRSGDPATMSGSYAVAPPQTITSP